MGFCFLSLAHEVASKESFMLKHSLLLLGLGTWIGSFAQGQLGVSPSQSSGLLRELRARTGEVTKDDPLGRDRLLLDQSRSLTNPSALSDSNAGATRLRGDLTGYPSQYQAGRDSLSPWSGTLMRPENERKVGGGTLGMALDQTFEWNELDPSWWSKRDAWLSSTMLSVSASHGSLETGRLNLNAAGGVILADSDDLFLSSGDGDVGWLMQPGSSLTYDVKIGDVTISLYDRFSARPDAVLSTQGRFPGLVLSPFFASRQNDLGAAVTWQMRPDLSLTLNYNWASASPVRSEMEDFCERDIHSVLASLSWDACKAARLGVEGGYAWTAYESDFQADGEQWHAGLFAEVSLPFEHRLRLDAGAQGMSFETLPGPTIFVFFPGPNPTPNQLITNTGDNADLGLSPFYTLTLSGRLSENVVHELSAGYEANLALVSNYVQAHFVNYGIQTELWRGASLGVSGHFEMAEDSGGLFAGDTTSYGGVGNLQQRLGRLTVSAHYGYTHFEADSQPQAIVGTFGVFGTTDQQAMGLTAAWQLCPKSSLYLGWQRISTELEFADETAEQSRAMVGMRVLF